MFEKMLTQAIGPDLIKTVKETLGFMAKKTNEAAENSKEQTRLLADILEELKALNGHKKIKK